MHISQRFDVIALLCTCWSREKDKQAQNAANWGWPLAFVTIKRMLNKICEFTSLPASTIEVKTHAVDGTKFKKYMDHMDVKDRKPMLQKHMQTNVIWYIQKAGYCLALIFTWWDMLIGSDGSKFDSPQLKFELPDALRILLLYVTVDMRF